MAWLCLSLLAWSLRGAAALQLHVVAGTPSAALATALALGAHEASTNGGGAPTPRSPVPPAQPIAFFETRGPERESERRMASDAVASLQNALLFLGPAVDVDDYERLLAQALQLSSRIADNEGDSRKLSLYAGIDFGCPEEARAIMRALSITHHRFSFLGLHAQTTKPVGPEDDRGVVLSRESAESWGNELSSLLSGRSTSSAAMAMDIRTHLAMLQANSLPRSRGVLGGDKDTWAITGSIRDGTSPGDGMLMKYQYDYTNPFGGCDPLLCPSAGLEMPSTSVTGTCDNIAIDDAYAAAYCALVGSGMDPAGSLAIAASVRAVFREFGTTDDVGVFCPPSYTWHVVDKIVERARQARQNIKREDGLPRKLYKEFGYK